MFPHEQFNSPFRSRPRSRQRWLSSVSLDLMRLAIVFLLAALFPSCAAPTSTLERDRYVVTYYDRNHDGIVDFELHRLPGTADSTWALSDTKFRGRYDVRLKFGYAFERESVSLPVPKHVKIASGKPPVFATR